jgi:hypothetical protein
MVGNVCRKIALGLPTLKLLRVARKLVGFLLTRMRPSPKSAVGPHYCDFDKL